MYFKKLEGEKVYLSPCDIDDAQKYSMWLNDRCITDNLGTTAKLNNTLCEREWLTKILERGEYTFAIVLKENNELIGNCSIMKPNFINRTATIGIFIGEEYWGKEYGTETLNMLLDYSFNVLNLNNIDLQVYSFNERAISCYKKVGFKEYGKRHKCYYLNGEYHDEVYMEILKEDYKKINNINV